MKSYNIGILGATGAVGREMALILEQRNFPVKTLRLFSGDRSTGSEFNFRGKKLITENASAASFDGIDIMLGAVEAALAREFVPKIKAAGTIFIDNSSAFRQDEEVPLIVPEINPDDAFLHKGIISSPNCTTIIALTAVFGIHKISPIECMVVSSYQAVSGAGVAGIEELKTQNADPEAPSAVFPCRISGNVIPRIGGFLENGYTDEEMKMQNEGRRIMHLPVLLVSCTCVRVPVMRSHSAAVTLLTRDAVSVKEAERAVASSPGCRLFNTDGRTYPTPLDSTKGDDVLVGRIRKDAVFADRGISLWCCGDQLQKGAAQNAVQIAELLVG